MTGILILIFFGSLIFSFFSHRYLIRNSARYTIRKANITGVRWNSQTKPILGGITFYTVFVLVFIGYVFFSKYDYANTLKLTGVFIVLTLSFFMGFADDLLNTPPGFKFIVQIINGILLIYFGVYIHVTSIEWLNYLLTVFWMTAIMNSFNMIDNMDAISSTIAVTILSGLLINTFTISEQNQFLYQIIIAGIIASLVAFLYFNWNPSKIYMGDNGSQFIGALLGVMAIMFAWNNSSTMPSFTTTRQFIIVILMFLVPITDTASVTINRILKGKSPFIGGRDHTTHHLSYLGLSDRMVAVVLGFISALSVTFSVMITQAEPSNLNMLLALVYIVVISGSLFLITRLTKPPVN